MRPITFTLALALITTACGDKEATGETGEELVSKKSISKGSDLEELDYFAVSTEVVIKNIQWAHETWGPCVRYCTLHFGGRSRHFSGDRVRWTPIGTG